MGPGTHPQISPVALVVAAVWEVDIGLVVVEHVFEVQEHPQRLGVMPQGEAIASRLPAAALAPPDRQRPASSTAS